VPVQIRKLSSDEAAKVFPKRGQMDLSEYADALRELSPGDAAEIEIGPLSSRALKRRLGQAAKQTGYSLKWARDGGGGVLRFQVREARGTQTKAGTSRARRRQRQSLISSGSALCRVGLAARAVLSLGQQPSEKVEPELDASPLHPGTHRRSDRRRPVAPAPDLARRRPGTWQPE